MPEDPLRRAARLADGLFPHQVDGVAFLLGRRRAILADDMGLGKTRQAIVAMTEAAPIGPWLVVCPASVKRNWEREIRIARPADRVHVCGPADPPDVGYTGWVVINYDILKHVDAMLEDLPWTGMIFDEAHYLKNHTSQRSKIARELVAAAPDAVLYALTGTPLTNRPRDLFPLLQLVRHPMGRSFLAFAKRYCAAHHNGFGWVTDGASHLDELRVQLHGVMLRRTKDEVLDLPPKLRTWLPVSVPEGTGRKETRRVLETLLGDAPGRERVRLLADLVKARQKIAIAKVPTTIDLVDGMIAQGEKALVFSAFDEPVQRIFDHFAEQGGAAVRLTGATPAMLRHQLVDRFQHDETIRVLVANIVVGGVGLNLTAARQVVFNDLDWVPANHWQAEDRAYRIGQKETVNVTYLSATNTVDEFVSHALRTKAALIEAVIEGHGDGVVSSDLLADLASLVRSLSPALDGDGGDVDPVDRLLREMAREARRDEPDERRAVREKLHRLPAVALAALARVLAGPTTSRYRVASGSKPGVSYVLEADASGDVTCSCPGFEYRGACAHARALKASLASGAALPEGMERVGT